MSPRTFHASTGRSFTAPLPLSPRTLALSPTPKPLEFSKPKTALQISTSDESGKNAGESEHDQVTEAANTERHAESTPAKSPYSARPASAGDRAEHTPAKSIRNIGLNSMNRSPSSMNLLRDASRQIPDPLPLRTVSADLASSGPAPSPSTASFKPPPPAEPPESVDIPGLIAASGSAEDAIRKLLVEKHSTASHNSQLWRLVEKQRAMILSLNKDLERACKDKDKYRRKLKDGLSSSTSLATLPEADSRNSILASDIEGDPAERTDSLTEVRLARHAGPSPLSTSSTPMSSKPMRAPFSTPASATSPMTPGILRSAEGNAKSVSNNSVATAVTTRPKSPPSLPRDYSIFKEQRLLATRKGPPTPLNLSYSSDALEDRTLPSEISQSSSVYTSRRTSPERDLQTEQAQNENVRVEAEARMHSTDRPLSPGTTSNGTTIVTNIQRTLSLSSSESTPETSPHLARLQTFQSLNSFAPVVVGQPLPNDQQKSAGIDITSRTDERPKAHALDLSNIVAAPRPLLLSAKSSPASPNSSLFPRSPNTTATSPQPSPLSTSSSPLLARPAAHALKSPSNERIVSAPNVAHHPHTKAIPTTSTSSIYSGFMSERFPGVLLPPPALQAVFLRVDTARFKQSRIHPPNKATEDTAVLALAVHAHADNSLLWRLEKSIQALASLEQQVRSHGVKTRARMPDRSALTGHAPARLDARRTALVAYFDELLDTQISESAAAIVSAFLSTDCVDNEAHSLAESSLGPAGADAITRTVAPASGARRDGYLARKGKNFGGWKARYFVLDGPRLYFYDTLGGQQLGVIEMTRARVAKQALPNEPSNLDIDIDVQHRHAFMILEPKRADSTHHIRHLLCAETDEERDAWVVALQYSELKLGEDKEIAIVEPPTPTLETNDKSLLRPATNNPVLKKSPRLQKSMNDVHKSTKEPTRENTAPNPSKSSNALRAVGYSDVVAAEAPIVGPTTRKTSANISAPMATTDAASDPISTQLPSISGPSNGTVIQDTDSWMHKATNVSSGKENKGSETKDRDRKRSLFTFRGRSTADTAQATPSEKPRPVFGAPLAEACELSRPARVDVYMPAVVYRCIDFLHVKGALNEEGIFRLSGSSTAIRSLKERFDAEGDIDLFATEEQFHDIHTVASLLKLYFRELPTNILTREALPEFLKAQDLEGEIRYQALNVLVNRLPRANREVLDRLSAFLKQVVENESVNKMTIRNGELRCDVPQTVLTLLSSWDCVCSNIECACTAHFILCDRLCDHLWTGCAYRHFILVSPTAFCYPVHLPGRKR